MNEREMVMTNASQPSDLDLCISALHALRLSRTYHASSEPFGQTARDVIQQLGGVEDAGYTNPPLKLAIAQAIHRAYLGPLPENS